MFEQRVVSSVVLAAGAVVAVLVGGWLFTGLALVACIIMAGEWSRLVPDVDRQGHQVMIGAAMLLPACAVIALQTGRPDLAMLTMLLGPLLAAAASALLPKIPPDRAAGGILYVGVPVLALVWLRNDVAGGIAHVLWLFLVVWATDIFAYVAGRSIGGPKLAPRVSPGKTWAGLGGGMVAAGIVGGVAGLLLGAGFWMPFGLGLVLALVAQAGDLFESALKRRASLKDSGHLIPGHGGLLDRIDGLIFAAPAFAALVWLFGSPSR